VTDTLHLRGDHRGLIGAEIVAVRYDPDRDTTEIVCGDQAAVQPARGMAPIPYTVTDAGLAALATPPATDRQHEPHTLCDGRVCRCVLGRRAR